jgi:hypothetical protein
VPLISFLCSEPGCWNADTRFYRAGCWAELGQHWSCQCPDHGHILKDIKDHVLHMAFDVSNDMYFHHGCPPDSCHLKLFFNKQNFSHVVVRIYVTFFLSVYMVLLQCLNRFPNVTTCLMNHLYFFWGPSIIFVINPRLEYIMNYTNHPWKMFNVIYSLEFCFK